MSHLTLSISGFQEIAKLTFFNELLSIHYVSVARFARIDEGDFFCNLEPLCLQHQYSRSLIHPDGRLAEAKVYQATFFIASNQPFLQYTKKFAQ